MRSSVVTGRKAAAGAAKEADRQETAVDAAQAAYDAFRAHLAMTMISDMFEHHADCRFRDCRAAGRCLALDNASGVCPLPLDTARAAMFLGMLWFHEAMVEAAEACWKAGRAAPRGG